MRRYNYVQLLTMLAHSNYYYGKYMKSLTDLPLSPRDHSILYEQNFGELEKLATIMTNEK